MDLRQPTPGTGTESGAHPAPAILLDGEHRYFVSGGRVPGFTEIARDLGVIPDNDFYTEAGREEGNALHEWLLFLAQGNEAESEPDPRIAGRVEGVRKFLRESGFRFAGGEEALFEPSLRYCCRPDLWGHIGNWAVVIDAKRGAAQPWHRLQTAAQKLALAANHFKAQKRYGLYLRDGDYRLVEHADAGDEQRWKALVAAYHSKSFYH